MQTDPIHSQICKYLAFPAMKCRPFHPAMKQTNYHVVFLKRCYSFHAHMEQESISELTPKEFIIVCLEGHQINTSFSKILKGIKNSYISTLLTNANTKEEEIIFIYQARPKNVGLVSLYHLRQLPFLSSEPKQIEDTNVHVFIILIWLPC